jgi:hypothetical protein
MMMDKVEKTSSSFVERALIRLDEMPLAAVIRLAVGYLVIPAWMMVSGGRYSDWTLIPFLFAILAVMRVAPAVARKAFPFGDALRTTWSERRQLAKRFDSYQWQKLLWIGLGMSLFAWRSGWQSTPMSALSLLSVVCGAIGLGFWRRHLSRGALCGS